MVTDVLHHAYDSMLMPTKTSASQNLPMNFLLTHVCLNSMYFDQTHYCDSSVEQSPHCTKLTTLFTFLFFAAELIFLVVAFVVIVQLFTFKQSERNTTENVSKCAGVIVKHRLCCQIWVFLNRIASSLVGMIVAKNAIINYSYLKPLPKHIIHCSNALLPCVPIILIFDNGSNIVHSNKMRVDVSTVHIRHCK